MRDRGVVHVMDADVNNRQAYRYERLISGCREAFEEVDRVNVVRGILTSKDAAANIKVKDNIHHTDSNGVELILDSGSKFRRYVRNWRADVD